MDTLEERIAATITAEHHAGFAGTTMGECARCIRAAKQVLAQFEQVGFWRHDVSDQCQHCEPDRLYQTWSKEPGMYYDAEDEADEPVYRLRLGGDERAG